MWRLNEKKSIAPTLVSGAVANGVAANYYFAAPVHVCLIHNFHATTDFRILINTNPTAAPSAGEASATAFEERIAAGQSLDVCREGLRMVKNLSVFFNGVINPVEILIAGVPV